MKGVAFSMFPVRRDAQCNKHKSKLEARVEIMAIVMDFIVLLITFSVCVTFRGVYKKDCDCQQMFDKF